MTSTPAKDIHATTFVLYLSSVEIETLILHS